MTEKTGNDEDEKAIGEVLETYIAPDIVKEIFFRLTCRSLARLMSTCKLWHSLVLDRDFIGSYQRRTVSNPSNFCLLNSKNGNIDLYSLDVDSFNHIRCIVPPSRDCCYDKMLASSYGLTCGVYSDHGAEEEMAVFNPITEQTMTVIKMPPYNPHNYLMGFGFHPQTKEYRFIVLSHSTVQHGMLNGHILTLQSGRWRMISLSISGAKDSGRRFRNVLTAVCAEGVLYWEHWSRHFSLRNFDILSFDLQSEELRWVTSPRIPECPVLRIPACRSRIGCPLILSRLTNLQEKLCLIEAVGNDSRRDEHAIRWTMDIWMLMDSIRSDWRLLYRLDFRVADPHDITGYYIFPLCIRNGKVILRQGGPKFHSYDIEEKSIRALKGKHPIIGEGYGAACAHAETLVSISN